MLDGDPEKFLPRSGLLRRTADGDKEKGDEEKGKGRRDEVASQGEIETEGKGGREESGQATIGQSGRDRESEGVEKESSGEGPKGRPTCSGVG
jgi:hypothetical protein